VDCRLVPAVARTGICLECSSEQGARFGAATTLRGRARDTCSTLPSSASRRGGATTCPAARSRTCHAHVERRCTVTVRTVSRGVASHTCSSLLLHKRWALHLPCCHLRRLCLGRRRRRLTTTGSCYRLSCHRGVSGSSRSCSRLLRRIHVNLRVARLAGMKAEHEVVFFEHGTCTRGALSG
jgi:hypothetical protein